MSSFFFNFLFCTGVQLIDKVVTVSGEEQRDSATHTHGSILPQTPLPSRPPDVASFLIADLDCQAQLDVILPVRGVVGRNCPGNSEDRRVTLKDYVGCVLTQ